MKKIVKAVLFLMIALTVTYVSAVVYANSSVDDSYDYRDPIEYGVWKHFIAERLETPPNQWNTTEKLGIVLVSSKVMEDRYHIYIDDPERALPWMNGTKPQPFAVKYGDNFYRISFLWVTPGPESIKQWQIPIGGALGVGWVFTGALFLKGRKKE